jgi:hypothetical protein
MSGVSATLAKETAKADEGFIAALEGYKGRH